MVSLTKLAASIFQNFFVMLCLTILIEGINKLSCLFLSENERLMV
jgi:uncharacterized phage infection (PIP) family protein YhgE